MLGGEGNQNVDSVGTISFQIPITTTTGTGSVMLVQGSFSHPATHVLRHGGPSFVLTVEQGTWTMGTNENVSETAFSSPGSETPRHRSHFFPPSSLRAVRTVP